MIRIGMIAGVLLALLTGAAWAQETYQGRWTFERQDTGQVVLRLSLDSGNGGVLGTGEATAALGQGAPASVEVADGIALEGDLQLRLTLRPTAGGLADSALLQVFSGNGPGRAATLVYRGRTISGVFLADGGQVGQGDPAVCREVDTLTEELNFVGDGAYVQEIRGLYTIHGLAFGGERTEARCAGLLADLYDLQEEAVIDQEASACGEMQRLTDEVVLELERIGTLESGQLDAIYYQAGMPSAIGPGGQVTEANCARTIRPLAAYLRDLRAIASASPPEGAFRQEAMTVLPVQGWGIANGGTAMSLWDHNDSLMAWETGPGNRRSIWYWEPRAGVRGVGVRRGTLFFEGERDGSRMRGEARVYTTGCGTWVYPVSGPIRADNVHVELTGDRPVIGDDCRVTGTRADRLIFDYVADAPGGGAPAPAPAPVDGGDDYDTPGFGVWAVTWRVNGIAANDTLNMRTGPGTEYPVSAELPPTARDILVLGAGCRPDLDQIAFDGASRAAQAQMVATRWCRVDWNGNRGWVYGRYIAPY